MTNAGLANLDVGDNYIYTALTIDTMPIVREILKEKVIRSPEEWRMNNSHVETLIKLYRQLPQKAQLDMVKMLKGYLIDGSGLAIKSVAMLTLCNTANAKIALSSIIASFNTYAQHDLRYSMLALANVLKFQPGVFKEEEVELLHDWAVEYLSGRSEVGEESREFDSLYSEFTKVIRVLHEKANMIITDNFTNQINAGFNPDINSDETRVREYLEEIGFPKDMVESLHHINDQINKSDTPFEFKNTMDSIRAFTERLFEMIAKSIDASTDIDGKDSKTAAKFFKEHGLVSGNMADLITSLRHFLSNDGVHRLKSKREDARIAKNIVVEVALYLLMRLKEL